ncbi:ABC transporter permease [bacterium c-19]|nr:ABC transporter permease [bacterium c-19]
MSWLSEWIPNVVELADEFPAGIMQTLQMLLIPGAISFVLGVIFGVTLIVTRKGGIMENRIIFFLLDKLVNLFRSIPFIILMTLLVGVTRFLTGTSIGVAGALPSLVVGTTPFFSRQIESALAEVDQGVIEASQAMGLSPMQIIVRVYLRESIPGIARATTITLISLVGLTAIAGAIGAGGLGDMAIRYGYHRNMYDVTYVVVIIILVMITLIQTIGDVIVKKTSH